MRWCCWRVKLPRAEDIWTNGFGEEACWSTVGNWSTFDLPLSTDTAQFDDTASQRRPNYTIGLGGPVSVGALNFLNSTNTYTIGTTGDVSRRIL